MLSIESFKEIFRQKVTPAGSSERAVFAEIDHSMRLPAIFFLSCAILWLIVGSVFALIASITLHSPNFFPNWECLTFGRIRSAHLSAVAYGWSNNVVYAVASWLMMRLSQTKVKYPWVLITAGVFWNLATMVGIHGMLTGQMTSVEWLEMPYYVAPVLAVSYLLIGIWSVLAMKFRKGEHIYVSQWYMLGALFWFPWLYVAVQTMIFYFPARGTVQALTNWWFGHNALGLWYTPISIAVIYYLIPKVLGKPIHSYYLSVLGFWSLALFYNWAGVHHLIGGPVPSWLVSVSAVASVMMVIPVLVTGINHYTTVKGSMKKVWESPTLRFVMFGSLMYTTSSLAGSAMSLREVNKVTHFTHFTVGHAHHGAYGFVAMVMFGAVYYMLPRLLRREWPSGKMIALHFWCVAIGILIYIFGMQIGGWIQGMEMLNAEIPFIETVKHTVPWLISRSVGGVFLTLGHIVFLINFIWMLFSNKQGAGATLFKTISNSGA